LRRKADENLSRGEQISGKTSEQAAGLGLKSAKAPGSLCA
jgi:hypothetical protein